MRRALALLLTVLALASPAGAIGQASKTAKAPAPQSQAPVSTQQVIQAPIPLASDRNAGDAMQCKSACARGYYFCAAQEDDTCPSNWAQCNARCTATYKRLGS